MTTQPTDDGIGDQVLNWGRSMMGFVEDLIGSETLSMGMDWWKSEQGRKVIDDWNKEAQRLTKERNDLKEKWVKKGRGLDTSTPEAGRSAYFYKPARVVENGDGTYGVDTNDDGVAERQFNSRDAAENYVEEVGGTSVFESYGGEGLYSREVEDVVIANQNQIRKVVQQLQSPEDRKKLLDAIAKFADLQAERTSSFITSALIDDDIVDDDGNVTESLSKARTELINNLNQLLGDTAEAINLADAIGTGEINKADFRRAVDVGDALKDQAGDVSDQEYYRAMAVVAANEDKYDLLLASSREAQLDVYNKLQAERYQGGFQGLSTRQTRDIAREFLANNTSLAKQLSDINIENAKILGDAHVRRAKLMGEADVKSAELEGDASVRGAERTRQSEMKQADRTGQAAISGATNEIKNKDYITDLRDRLKFDGYRQEVYEMDRITDRDKALSSGVLEEQKMLQPYRMGPADFGDPDVAQQMYSPEFDWVSNLLDRITKGGEGGDSSGLIGTLIGSLKDGFSGIASGIAGMFGGNYDESNNGFNDTNAKNLGFNDTNELKEDMKKNPTNYTLDELGNAGLNPDGSDNYDESGGGLNLNNANALGFDSTGELREDMKNNPTSYTLEELQAAGLNPDGTPFYDETGGGLNNNNAANFNGFNTQEELIADMQQNPTSYTLEELGTAGLNPDGSRPGDSSVDTGVDTGLTLEEQGLKDDMQQNPTNYTLDELALAGLNPDGSQTQVQSQAYGGTPGQVVYNPETGLFEVTGEDGSVVGYTKEEMDELGIAIPEGELAMYEASTRDFQMTDEELGLGGDDPFGGLGDFELGGGEDLLNQSGGLLDSSTAVGGGAATIAGGGAASALAGSGGTGTLGGVISDSIGGDGVTGLGGVEQDLGYGLNPDGTAITHDQFMATAAGGNNLNDLATNYGGGFNLDFGLGDFNFQDLPD